MKTKMNPIIDPEKMLPEVERMLYAQALKFSLAYPIPFQEARSEAYNGFMQACYSYNPEKGSKFSSWCYSVVWWELKDLAFIRCADPHVMMDMNPDGELERREVEKMIGETPQLTEVFMEALEDATSAISQDAREILSLLLETPDELLEGDRPTAKQLFYRIRENLMDKGRTKRKIDKARQELERVLEPVWA